MKKPEHNRRVKLKLKKITAQSMRSLLRESMTCDGECGGNGIIVLTDCQHDTTESRPDGN